MKLNIITPCSRPENLHIISESINIPKENYRWIVVFDLGELPDKKLIPNNCEVYLHKNPNSTSGNSQRNYAIDLVNDGYLYFNDDDTIIHVDLWENIKNLNYDFISFKQNDAHGNLRLIGDCIEVGKIDSHNFLVSKNIVMDSKFVIDKYDADGYFAIECYKKSKNIHYINKILSVYNSLR
jgi:hypothetical protein